jgi:hypothetical protein
MVRVCRRKRQMSRLRRLLPNLYENIYNDSLG